MSNLVFREKYLKYKAKYLSLRSQIEQNGGFHHFGKPCGPDNACSKSYFCDSKFKYQHQSVYVRDKQKNIILKNVKEGTTVEDIQAALDSGMKSNSPEFIKKFMAEKGSGTYPECKRMTDDCLDVPSNECGWSIAKAKGLQDDEAKICSNFGFKTPCKTDDDCPQEPEYPKCGPKKCSNIKSSTKEGWNVCM